MNIVGTEQILRGEPGFIDLAKPAPVEAVRVPVPRQTLAEARIVLDGIAVKIETLLKEAKKPKHAEGRLKEIEQELRSILGTLSAELTTRAREKAEQTLVSFFAPRFKRLARLQTNYFQTVVNARVFAHESSNAKIPELLERAAKAVELYRSGGLP